MKTILHDLRSSAMAVLVMAIVCCGIYPLVVYGFAQAIFPHKANGSLIVDAKGNVRGSELLGQRFVGDRYFNSRPSAAGNGYDGANSAGSNLGPTSKKLNDSISDAITHYRQQNGLKDSEPIPADAVTSSGSGLDPHISLANAAWQVPRVAKTRNLSVTRVQELVSRFTEGPDMGILGEAGLNVLKLNLALDEAK